jgi:hypothetical protein
MVTRKSAIARQRVSLYFPEKDVASQEVGIGGVGMGFEVLANDAVRIGDFPCVKERFSFCERRIKWSGGRSCGLCRVAGNGGRWLGFQSRNLGMRHVDQEVEVRDKDEKN